jgi:membrane-associated phospholipid phosphatase
MTAVPNSKGSLASTPLHAPVAGVGLPSSRAYWCAALLGLAALPALACDVPVSQFVLSQHGREPFEALLQTLSRFEPFAHSIGVAIILTAVLVLDRARRRAVPRLVACAFGAGLLADVVKIIVHRSRPKEIPDATSVWQTFHGWLPLFEDLRLATERTIQSFPSGHTATAAGLAIGLSWLYPRGTWFFVSLAVLASLQRVASAAHYPSDVCAAAAIACLVSAICLDPRLLGRFFSKLEAFGKPATKSTPMAAPERGEV